MASRRPVKTGTAPRVRDPKKERRSDFLARQIREVETAIKGLTGHTNTAQTALRRELRTLRDLLDEELRLEAETNSTQAAGEIDEEEAAALLVRTLIALPETVAIDLLIRVVDEGGAHLLQAALEERARGPLRRSP